jgi:transcriptional regulator with XRE-family HTH domain
MNGKTGGRKKNYRVGSTLSQPSSKPKRTPLLTAIIGEKLKELRLTRTTLRQEDLAGICGVDRAYISLIERGKNEPSVSKIFELCEAMNISPTEFFQMVEEDYKKQRNKPTE